MANLKTSAEDAATATSNAANVADNSPKSPPPLLRQPSQCDASSSAPNPHEASSKTLSPPMLWRLYSDDWMSQRHNDRPHLSYLRSAWASQDLNPHIVSDELPLTIRLPPPPSPSARNANHLAQEARPIALAGSSLLLFTVISGSLISKATSTWPNLLMAIWWIGITILCATAAPGSLRSLTRIATPSAVCTLSILLPQHIQSTMTWSTALGLMLSALGMCLVGVAHYMGQISDRLTRQQSEQATQYHQQLQTLVDKETDTYTHQRLLFLSTVSQEIQDAALMVITTLEQFSPATILAGTQELLSACSIAVPISSISAINTTIKQICYVSSNLQLIARMQSEGDESGEGMVSNVRREFDIGELVQNLGDALAGMAAKLFVNLVIYHSDNALHHCNVVGDEGAIRNGLLDLLRHILEGCTPGACIELGLNVSPSEEEHKLTVTFEITQTASPALPKGVDPALLPSANFTSQLLHYVGATFEVEEAEKSRTRYNVKIDMEMGSDNPQQLLLMEDTSLSLTKQFGNIKFSNDPTLKDLAKFIENLKGLKMVLHAPEESLFATHLTSCLASWNADISHVPVVQALSMTEDEMDSVAADSDTNTSISSYVNRTSTPEVQGTPTLASPRPPNTPKIPSPATEEEHIHSVPPAFILIDDDIQTLDRKLREFRSQPPVSASILQSHQHSRRHKHSKSSHHHQNFFHHGTTGIIHFTSLTNYKRVRDLVQSFALSATQPFSVPRLVVVPKPAGPRRFLTALHTAWHNAIVQPHFMPIATSPSSPMPQAMTPLIHRDAGTPPTPGSAYVGTPSGHESDKGIPRGSPGEGTTTTPIRRRPGSGLYSPPVTIGEGANESTNYFSMIGSATQIQTGSSSPRSGMSNTRRRSHTEAGAHFSPQQQQQQQTPPTPGLGHAPGGFAPTDDRTAAENTPEERKRRSNPVVDLEFGGSPSRVESVPNVMPGDGKGSPGVTKMANSPLVKTQMQANPAESISPSPTSRRVNTSKLKKKRSDKKDLNNTVSPPINVLIVEDNMINQAILSTWMKKHKIKYSVASNGQEAVERWKKGGFHLVLMDIQLPVMDGIEATKTIRAIEKEQKIGVLPTTAPAVSSVHDTTTNEPLPEQQTAHAQDDPQPPPFRSPVIIVALTASSLESDRHAALTAGCNDFLTKPVSLEWLEKKIVEWGCMQALIDFEGWRRWKRTATDRPSFRPPSSNQQQQKETPTSETSPTLDAKKAIEPARTIDPGRKYIILPGVSGMANKRRFSTMDDKPHTTPAHRRTLLAMSKSGSDSDLLPNIATRMTDGTDSPPRQSTKKADMDEHAVDISTSIPEEDK